MVIEKHETKNVKKSQKKALTCTERLITIQILHGEKTKDKGENETMRKLSRLKKMLKTKYSDKDPAFFGNVNNLMEATNATES